MKTTKRSTPKTAKQQGFALLSHACTHMHTHTRMYTHPHGCSQALTRGKRRGQHQAWRGKPKIKKLPSTRGNASVLSSRVSFSLVE